MEKALNILKDLCIVLDFNSYWKPRVNEAIAELEEMQQHRSCEGCKHGKYGADSRGIEVECTLIWHCARGNGFPDRYEAKDTK